MPRTVAELGWIIKQMTVDEILHGIRSLGAGELVHLIPGIPAALPVDYLLLLGEEIAKAVEADNEKSQMQAAADAADASIDALEAAALNK